MRDSHLYIIIAFLLLVLLSMSQSEGFVASKSRGPIRASFSNSGVNPMSPLTNGNPNIPILTYYG